MISPETGDESLPCGPNRGNSTLLFVYFVLFALQPTGFLLNSPRSYTSTQS